MKRGDCRSPFSSRNDFFLPVSILTEYGLETIEMHSCKVKSELPIKGQLDEKLRDCSQKWTGKAVTTQISPTEMLSKSPR